MDGLSVLIGILTGVFLIVLFGTNIWNNRSFIEEPFADVASSDLLNHIHSVLDPLALYTSPDGTSIPDGKDLCSVFAVVRNSMTPPEAATEQLSPSEILKRVEAQLAIDIPGGPLPCPLLKYPKATATDLELLTWLQDIPTNFGARVVFMAAYADNKLSEVAKKMKDALAGDLNIPEIPEMFVNVCTPTLDDAKKQQAAASSCVSPETLTPEQIKTSINELLDQFVSEKTRILSKKIITDPLMTTISPHKHIENAKIAAAYLDKQKKAAEAGTLKMGGTVDGVYKDH